MRDFLFMYFEWVKRIQKHFGHDSVKIMFREDGSTSIYCYDINLWILVYSTDTLSEFITWIESLS